LIKKTPVDKIDVKPAMKWLTTRVLSSKSIPKMDPNCTGASSKSRPDFAKTCAPVNWGRMFLPYILHHENYIVRKCVAGIVIEISFYNADFQTRCDPCLHFSGMLKKWFLGCGYDKIVSDCNFG